MRAVLNAGAGAARQAGVIGVAVGFLLLGVVSFTTDSLLFLAGWLVDLACWIGGAFLLWKGYSLMREGHKAEVSELKEEIRRLEQKAQFSRIDDMAEREGLHPAPRVMRG